MLIGGWCGESHWFLNAKPTSILGINPIGSPFFYISGIQFANIKDFSAYVHKGYWSDFVWKLFFWFSRKVILAFLEWSAKCPYSFYFVKDIMQSQYSFETFWKILSLDFSVWEGFELGNCFNRFRIIQVVYYFLSKLW